MLSDTEHQLDERQQEFLALINMIGYTIGIAESLHSTAAAHLDAARDVLMNELQGEFARTLSKEALAGLATTRAGMC